MIVTKELCVNPTVYNIQITYHMPHEVLKHRINYKYMAIEVDKHVKIMFDKLKRILEVNGIELYIQLELHVEVCIEEIQQTTTSLQVTILDAQYEYSTHVKDDDFHDDDDDDNDDYVDETAINGEDFVNRDEYEERIEPLGTLRGTLRETLMTMRHLTIMNLMQTMLLMSKTLRTQSLPTHLLPYHFL